MLKALGLFLMLVCCIAVFLAFFGCNVSAELVRAHAVQEGWKARVLVDDIVARYPNSAGARPFATALIMARWGTGEEVAVSPKQTGQMVRSSGVNEATSKAVEQAVQERAREFAAAARAFAGAKAELRRQITTFPGVVLVVKQKARETLATPLVPQPTGV